MLAYQTSPWDSLSQSSQISTTALFCGLKHLEEIKTAGLELPTVNQIEVRGLHSIILDTFFSATAIRQLTFLQLHPFCQQKPIVAWCREHNIVVQAYCPLLRGRMNDPVLVDIANKASDENGTDRHKF